MSSREYDRGWNDAMAAVAESALPAAQQSATRAERERVTRIIRELRPLPLLPGGPSRWIDIDEVLAALDVEKTAVNEGGA